jgi:hypothetical protein
MKLPWPKLIPTLAWSDDEIRENLAAQPGIWQRFEIGTFLTRGKTANSTVIKTRLNLTVLIYLAS